MPPIIDIVDSSEYHEVKKNMLADFEKEKYKHTFLQTDIAKSEKEPVRTEKVEVLKRTIPVVVDDSDGDSSEDEDEDEEDSAEDSAEDEDAEDEDDESDEDGDEEDSDDDDVESQPDEVEVKNVVEVEKKKKIELHDGVKKVEKVQILALFRNNAKYLNEFFLPRMVTLEAKYDTTFEYLFLENDSTDDTKKILSLFLARDERKGSLTSLNLPEFKNLGINYERTSRLAMLRNKLSEIALQTAATRDSWRLHIDSDMHFGDDQLGLLFEKKPKANGIAMLSAFSCEGLFGRQVNHLPQFEKVADDAIVSFGHYYDTFAFVGLDGRNHRPKCMFEPCEACKSHEPEKRLKKEELIDVRSCYNGFAIVDNNVFLDHPGRIEWGTVDIEGKHSLCEHVLFCNSLKAATGLRICVAGDVSHVFWTNP